MAIRYIIASGKGGVGKSSVTAGLGKALTANGKKVLCIDADIGLRSLDVLLNAGEGIVFNWADTLGELCTYDNALIRNDKEMPALLIPPTELSRPVTADDFCTLVAAYDSSFDYIFIDLPAGMPEIFESALAVADRALVVCTPDFISSRCAAAVTDKISKTVSDVRLVINRFDREAFDAGRQLGLDACVDRVCARLIGVIPEDSSVAQLPRLSDYAYFAFRRTAARIEGQDVPLKAKFF